VLALDNKEAKIEIANEVPIATSISQPQDTTQNIYSQVQFKSAGVILSVTPHVNEKKQVTLKISQEVSELGENVLIGGQAYQGFITRKAITSAIVQDGHTLIIGGIISENKRKDRVGIPLLSEIPVFGYLFGSTTDSTERRELILMVTPHVVSTHDEADLLTQEYESRIKAVKRKIESLQKSMEKKTEISPIFICIMICDSSAK
jgi:general secretion pathway protein D